MSSLFLHQHLKTLFALNDEDAGLFLSSFKRMTLKKGELFSIEGQVCNRIGLIETGLVKCVFPKDGIETVFEFAFEGQFIADYYSFITRSPSEKQIVCLEDTVVYLITQERLEKLGSAHPFIGDMSRRMNELLFLKMHDKARSLLLEDAQQRYLKLISQRPDLVNRIPQYLLASYLNVTPETVSRIRKKLAVGLLS